jgi:hypothetical protein
VPSPLFKERSGGLLVTFRFKQLTSQRVIQLDLRELKQAGFIQLKGHAQLVAWVLI